MHMFGSIAVSTIAHVETDDLIAYEHLGHVKTGKVLLKAYSVHDLTEWHIEYLKKHHIKIDVEANPFGLITSPGEYLIFWVDAHGVVDHFYSAGDRLIAVFAYTKKD